MIYSYLSKKSKLVRPRIQNRTGIVTIGGILLLLSGCNSLPDSGPTEAQVNHFQRDAKKNSLGYGIVQMSPNLVALLAKKTPATFSSLDTEAGPARDVRNDTVGPGDVLQISIYEVGSALFSASHANMIASTASGTNTIPSTSTSSNLPPVSVDGSGNIEVPFAGQIYVTGLTADEIAQSITSRLKEKSQSPQVLVRIASDIANSVMVYGGVQHPSRVLLTPSQEHVLDVIALAGGADHTSNLIGIAGGQQITFQSDEDYVVRLTRRGHIAELPLQTIEKDPQQNIVMQPGDRVQLVLYPRTFTTFGASGRVTQTQFNTPNLTLAEAISRSGGPIDTRADPNAVYLFRFEDAEVLRQLGLPIDQNAKTGPVIYQLDMMNPSNYFLAEKFMMQDRDLIYIANASSNKFYKFFGLISTLISPGITAAWMAK